MQNKPHRVLSVFALVMINVIAVDSLRTLPIAAEYGFSLLFFYGLGALVFFIPTAFVTAELSTTWPQTGGIYVWVREAFGSKWGFLVIWIQWIYNIVWYPTILSFVASMIAYIVNPALINDKSFIIGSILALFWSATIINFIGMRASSWVSTIGSVVGTLLPMLLIMALGGYWIYLDKPLQIDFSLKAIVPEFNSLHDIVLLSAILYGLVGLEMSAVHAAEVKNPARDYPRALLISVVIIIFSLSFSSLAVAMVVPKSELSLVAGIIQAFSAFFTALNMPKFIPVIALLMIIGGVASVATWIIGPTKGLLAAARDGLLPNWLSYTNKNGVPIPILITQGAIFSVLSLVYWLMPTVNASYWVLTELTAQLALIMYAIMFVAAIVLRYKKAGKVRPYRIFGRQWGMWLIAGIAFITCVAVIALGFVPPTHVEVGNIWRYEAVLVCGIIAVCLPPFLIHKHNSK